jgi:tryptophan halogenase
MPCNIQVVPGRDTPYDAALNQTPEIRSLLVIGGGTAGWMTANYLSRFLRRTETEIILIESPSIASIGVGEATLPSLVRFIRNMGFDEKEFMLQCKATFKLGIKFTNWIRREYSYWHPFGICGSFIDGIDLFHFWLKFRHSADERYSAYSLQARIADMGKSPCPIAGSSRILDTGAYAYHLDAGAFADYLRLKAVSAGVIHVSADIAHVSVNDENKIEHVITADDRKFTADLYIDCTGFQGILIGKALGTKYLDWSKHLLCDRAVVIPLPIGSDIHPNTVSTALSAGWCWQIPLRDRVGCGYVYSSNYISDEQAASELAAFAGVDEARRPEPRYLQMAVGRREEFWRGNCVAIGLAGGFIEPLESTGIHFIQYGLETLMDMFPDRNMNPALGENYNRLMVCAYEEIRDFIMLHYYLSRRDDSAFWQDCRNLGLTDTLKGLLRLYGESGNLSGIGVHVFPDTSYYHILSGGEYLPKRPSPMVNVSDPVLVKNILREIRNENTRLALAMPSHKSYLDSLN